MVWIERIFIIELYKSIFVSVFLFLNHLYVLCGYFKGIYHVNRISHFILSEYKIYEGKKIDEFSISSCHIMIQFAKKYLF